MSSDLGDLQFQKAELPPSGRVCTRCQQAIPGEYWQIDGSNICASCAAETEASQQQPKNRWVLRGVLYGAGTALLCSIAYAIIVWVTNFELGLMAIAVGYLVGRAVRHGSNGLGGRRCQVAAVILTYLSITTSYMPLMIKSMMAEEKKQAGAAAKPSTPPAEPLTPVTFVIAVVLMFGFSFVVPFLALSSGFSGIIGLFIIFLGLQQAWKQTQRDMRALVGPFQPDAA